MGLPVRERRGAEDALDKAVICFDREAEPRGKRTEYRLTPAGRVLQPIIDLFGEWGARWAIQTFQPASFQMEIVYAWWPRAALVTLLAATLGALYPGFNAARQDPIEALAYE